MIRTIPEPPSAQQPSIRATAFHESGHVVVAVSLGLPINFVSIVPGDDGSLGRVGHPPPSQIELGPNPTNREWKALVREYMVMALGGLPAERLVDPNARIEGQSHDEDNVYGLAREYGIPVDIRLLTRRAVEIVRRESQAVEALAELLLVRREIDGNEAVALVEQHLVRPA